MKRKVALTAIIIFALIGSLVAGLQAVEVAEANPIVFPTKPITDPPTLIIQSPINNYSYLETSVPLNITVIKPASWGPSGNASIYYDCGISYIHYILDGTSYSLFQSQLINPIPQDLLPTISNFSQSLKDLRNGAHSLQVIIYALSQWCPDNSGPYGTSVPPFYFYNMTVTSEIIHFTVGLQTTSSPSPTINPTIVLPAATSTTLPTPSPTPSITPSSFPTHQPTIEPTLTVSPTQSMVIGHRSDDLTFKVVSVLIGITAIAIAAVVGVIVYFKKFKK